MPRTSFLSDVVGIFGTRAARSVLGIVGGVVLARWLGPHDRGVLALVLLLPATAITMVKLGVPQSCVYFINRDKWPAETVASNVFSLALLLGTAVAAACWLLRDPLLDTVLPGVPTWALALALLRVPLLLIDDYFFGVLQAVGKFGIYNRRLIEGELLRIAAILVALVGFDMGLYAAVLIHTAVSAVMVVWLLVAVYREIPFTISMSRTLLRGQLEFGFKSWIQTLTQHMLLRIDVYMVAYYLGPAETAFYSLALRFTEMVLEIPQAIGLVLYPRLASLAPEEIYRLTAQTCRRTLALTGVCAAGLALLGPPVIVLWYGPDYAPAGDPLLWAAVGVIAMSIYVIVTRAFTSQNRQRINIAAGLPALVLNVALNAVMIPQMGIVGAALATAIAYSIACIVLLTMYTRESRATLREILIADRNDLQYFYNVGKRSLHRVQRMARKGSAGGLR